MRHDLSRLALLAWLAAAACSASGGPGPGPAPGACATNSIANSGGLCTISLTCSGMPVGLSCGDTNCVCTRDGRSTGVRFNTTGACMASDSAAAALYERSCMTAAVDAATPAADARVADVPAPPPPPPPPPDAGVPETPCERYCTVTLRAMCGETREACLEFCSAPERMGGRCASERDRFVTCSIAGTAECVGAMGIGVGLVAACNEIGLSYARCVSMMR